jgi:hypothetical protein
MMKRSLGQIFFVVSILGVLLKGIQQISGVLLLKMFLKSSKSTHPKKQTRWNLVCAHSARIQTI